MSLTLYTLVAATAWSLVLIPLVCLCCHCKRIVGQIPFLPHDKNRVYFESYGEAEENGYQPCKKCKPSILCGDLHHPIKNDRIFWKSSYRTNVSLN